MAIISGEAEKKAKVINVLQHDKYKGWLVFKVSLIFHGVAME